MKILICAILLLSVSSATLSAQQPDRVGPPKITVSGEALVYAKPDKIVLNFGIETGDKKLLAARQKNGEIWERAARALKELNVPSKEIQTDYISITPQYKGRYDEINNEPVGYVARNLFVVNITDPAKVENVISKMLEVGVNNVNGVEFQTTDFKRLRESARELALTAAREKAQKMAAVLGCHIGKPLAIDEGYGGGSYYFSSWNSWGGYRGSSGMSQNAVQDSRGAGDHDPQSMALGKISIHASVSVTFELKDDLSEGTKR